MNGRHVHDVKALQTTLFLIAFVILGTQTVRHIYVKWIEPRSSVLDAYGESVDSAIASAATLEELVALYDSAHRAVEQFKGDSSYQAMEPMDRHDDERIRTKSELREEILAWEARTKNIFELRFFWSLGFMGVVLGVLGRLKANAWMGMAAIIAGFSEMIYWTSPLNRYRAGPEFERLLTEKLVLSLVAWMLLIGLWLMLARRERQPTHPG